MADISTHENNVVNINHLASLTGSKEESAQGEVLELFLINSKECISAMAHSLQETSHAYQWGTAISELKALSDMVGATSLHKACVTAAAKAEADSATKRQALDNINAEMQKLRTYIRKMK